MLQFPSCKLQPTLFSSLNGPIDSIEFRMTSNTKHLAPLQYTEYFSMQLLPG